MVECDLSELPTEEIRSALRDTIEKKLKSKKYKISVTSASPAGSNNFVGIVYRISFSKDDENNQTKLILKVAPQNVARRDQFFSRDLFLREIFLYEEVLPYLRQFEQSKGIIAEENGFIEYPKCYRSIDVELSESLFLEDMSVRDLSIIDRHTQEVTVDHVRLVMKCLGKFHALSFALKDQQPDKFNEFVAKIPEIFIRKDNTMITDYLQKQMEYVFNVLADKKDAHLLQKMKKMFEKSVVDVATSCFDVEATRTGSVISHGDAWQNNIMFKYDSNGKPVDVSLLDWQIARHCSPILDIVYFMFCCTTKELRDAHYHSFLKDYYDSLSAHIRRLGSDPETLFSFDLMHEHFRKFAKYGLIMATAVLPVITLDGGQVVDMDEMATDIANGKKMNISEAFISENSRSKFYKRLRDVIVDMDRLGYL